MGRGRSVTRERETSSSTGPLNRSGPVVFFELGGEDPGPAQEALVVPGNRSRHERAQGEDPEHPPPDSRPGAVAGESSEVVLAYGRVTE